MEVSSNNLKNNSQRNTRRKIVRLKNKLQSREDTDVLIEFEKTMEENPNYLDLFLDQVDGEYWANKEETLETFIDLCVSHRRDILQSCFNSIANSVFREFSSSYYEKHIRSPDIINAVCLAFLQMPQKKKYLTEEGIRSIIHVSLNKGLSEGFIITKEIVELISKHFPTEIDHLKKEFIGKEYMLILCEMMSNGEQTIQADLVLSNLLDLGVRMDQETTYYTLDNSKGEIIAAMPDLLSFACHEEKLNGIPYGISTLLIDKGANWEGTIKNTSTPSYIVEYLKDHPAVKKTMLGDYVPKEILRSNTPKQPKM